MNIIEVRKVEMVPNPHGVDVRKLYVNEKIQVNHITPKPGRTA